MSGRFAPASSQKRCAAEVALLAAALSLLAGYVLLRYGGRVGETDASANVRFIQAMYEQGRLLYRGALYPNGYGYQALSTFLLNVAGITASGMQLYLHLFLMPWIVLPAWLLYRELTGSGRGAILATVILVVQPEFLFPLLRGTHEKFTRGLILLALYLFVKSLGQAHRPARLAGYLIAFYLAVYGFIALNNLLAFSAIVGLLLALALLGALHGLLGARVPTRTAAIRRLGFAVLISGVLAFLFTFYFYPPARYGINVLESMLDRTAALVLDVEFSEGANPYIYTAGAWVSTPVYLVLSLANWLLLLVSASIWVWWSLQLVLRRAGDQQSGQVLLWALYGAFALQGALSILVDFSGALSANLQVRAFPAFVMLAAPVVGGALVRWLDSERLAGRRIRRIGWVGMAGVLAVLAALSALKATNEPLVSNKWSFYLPGEMQAVDRASSILSGRRLWTSFDERLNAARILRDPESVLTVALVAYNSPAENVLVSDIILASAARIFLAPPIEADSLRVYDNGQAQLYHLRPRTPFQR